MQDIARGGYVLKDAGGKPDLILIATGSEVEITVLAAEKLLAKGVNVRVVSLPSTDVFDARMRLARIGAAVGRQRPGGGRSRDSGLLV
ncbi:transketolase [Klebsiella pneumoniae]|nr:transketolase [Klebsiella pneumoniae]